MFKIREKSRETVALSTLQGLLTQSLHGQHHKKDIKQWHLTACISMRGLNVSRILCF